jgi:AraC-like DNA-binding protein
MLLWPQMGALDSRWMVDGAASPQHLQLTRHTALLLPASAPHSTRSSAHRQRHGELYLRPEFLKSQHRYGVLRLDAATVAMLDALASPALKPESGGPLIEALMIQLAAQRTEQWLSPSGQDRAQSIAQRMLQRYAQALDGESAMPTVDAVAQELGVSIRHLQRACAEELGSSPVALRRKLLAARARELMGQGMASAQVSQQLGFTHSGHLHRLLRGVQS